MDELSLAEQRKKEDLFLLEYGFGYIVELMLKKFKADPECSLIGHNMMYDNLFFYNQFIAPLPATFAEFSKAWNSVIPNIFDTKVLSAKSEYFGKTILSKVFEKSQNDKKMKDILEFRFDVETGFTNYEGTEALSHYHEAAYDAYMTGVCYAKILKYKEIDMVFLQNKKGRGKPNKRGKAAQGEDGFEEVKEQKFVDPKLLHNTPVQAYQGFGKPLANLVMLNQFENCACYPMNPAIAEPGCKLLEEKQKQVVKITFKESFNTEEESAEAIANLFSQFGDFHVYKDTKKSVLLCFYHIHSQSLPEASPKGFIQYILKPEVKEKLQIEDCCTLSQS